MTEKFWTYENAPEYQGGSAVQRWADEAMYAATPLADVGEHDEPVKPRVTLLYMTSDPLRVMAAAAELYRGNVVTNASEVPRETALAWLRDMTKTELQAPLEFIDLHFLLEGVTRAFTHQLVRQRTAVYVQESQRFAVKEDARWEVAMPPSIAALKKDDPNRRIWEDAIARVSWAYNSLINGGIPAEDARGLLPTNITTRVHYHTNLRNLVSHAGKRLCSQAQYEWKQVWHAMLIAIQNYGPDSESWQQYEIANLFKPVCYFTGKCEFMAETDRYCRIRERVQAHAARGEHPDTWTDINPIEPILEGAARIRPGTSL